MTTHRLKIRSEWLARVAAGEKRTEVRKHDRDFQAGDAIEFVEVKEAIGMYAVGGLINTPERVALKANITHVLPGHMVDGISDDYCVLSIEVAS